jgi:flagellar basal body rod protein FlgC
MSSVASIAMSGMHAAASRLEASAVRVARASVEPLDSGSARSEPRVDYAEEAVNQTLARYDFAANALVLRTHTRMMATLYDAMA